MAMEQNKWLDISSEKYRDYIFVSETGALSRIRIELPLELMVTPSSMGGHAHRIKTAAGEGVYMAPGWKTIIWMPKEGADIFTF